MAKEQKKKKSNTKKNKNVKNNINKTKIILAVFAILIVLLVIILVWVFNERKTIECTKQSNNKAVITKDALVIKMNKSGVDNIVAHKTISLDKDKNGVDYLSAIKVALEDTYKKLGIKYLIKEENNDLVIDLTYNKKQEYILDNIFIDREEDGLSFNVISEDRENDYAKIDLSKKYKNKDIIEILEKSDYKCK